MFRKLISNLSFSPALITQVGFYARRLRKEEVTRQLTIVFTVLALLVQSLAVFSPPESANASSEQDLIRGGVQNIDDFLARYDKNSEDIKDIYTTAGVTREEIAATAPGVINSQDGLYAVTRYAQYTEDQGEISFSYNRSTGGKGIRYSSPLALADTRAPAKEHGKTYQAYIGTSAKLGWFAVIKSSAGLATQGKPSTITPLTDNNPVVRSLITANVTKDTADATQSPARAFDKITYTITAKNTSNRAAATTFNVHLSDALEYATLIDAGGGSIDSETKQLLWPATTLAPGATEQRTFVVQLLADIPATATGTSNGNSYDCVMATSFGTTVRIPVECPSLKGLEGIISELPPTSIAINLVISAIFVTLVVYFYVRTRQMKKEIRLIRHSLNTGTI